MNDCSSDSTASGWTRRSVMAGAAASLVAPAIAAGGFEWRPWDMSRGVPGLALAATDGTHWQLAQQRGRVVVVNFWATWCEPCRDEMPSLARLAALHAASGLRVVAVNYRETAAKAGQFMTALGLDLPVLLDLDGSAAMAWTPRIFPSTVLIERRGQPSGVLVGGIDWTGPQAQALVSPLLSG